MESKEEQQEQERLSRVIDVIQRQKQARIDEAGLSKQEVIDMRKTFWDEVTVNLDEPDDIIETEASIRQRAELLGEHERSYQRFTKHIRTLERLETSPYFGRLDFQETGESKEEAIYIGIASLEDEQQQEFLVYDWRAPISSMYYDYAPGAVKFSSGDGEVHGEMTKKRQYLIERGELKGMFDTGLTIGDQLLQQLLSQSSSDAMTNIVSTIQREQNAIIRNERSRMLIVQGAAGSGKTSAAMQRVAYLLYKYREQFDSANMLLLSPNPLFNRYVSGVLPELGEENLKQTTFQHHIAGRLPDGWTLESPFRQIERLLTEDDANIRYAEPDYIQELDRFIEQLNEEGMKFTPLVFRGDVWKSGEDIADLFYSYEDHISTPNRLELMAEQLETELKAFERKEADQPWAEEEAQMQPKDVYNIASKKVRQKLGENPSKSDQLEEERLVRRFVVRQSAKPVFKQIEAYDFVDITSLYEQFSGRDLTDRTCFMKTLLRTIT
ncbi:ATP-dependent DNA helicase Rep [Geomicrobium sp. JCM 19037]|uniref:RNA polymerase recycling motor HelD n=1 Tax=Geomicrobium sp. JCM 19037 TaxID=1460634 RepID=UPI00045F3DCE|nr:RNA polymerase recycling motor HelD [Geomicrobium sp. JCM 19037]GAK06124.1 ATP-dependent DNA helicase Rep [Geomicrobium sp. JCM 19037]